MEKNKEIRSYGGDAAPTINGRTIEGYAVVFGQRSNVMYDWSVKYGERLFVEVIEPTAIDAELLSRSDIKATAEHNRERLLARYNKGKGTMQLEQDNYGLKYRFDAPNTVDGNFAVEMIQRGDISGSSFAFRVKEADTTWKKEGETWVRTIHKISGLYDVTITTDPAYSQTEVTVRSLEEMEVPEKEVEQKEIRNDDNYEIELELLRRKI